MNPLCTILCQKSVLFHQDVRQPPIRGETIEANQDPKRVKSFGRSQLRKSSILDTTILYEIKISIIIVSRFYKIN